MSWVEIRLKWTLDLTILWTPSCIIVVYFEISCLLDSMLIIFRDSLPLLYFSRFCMFICYMVNNTDVQFKSYCVTCHLIESIPWFPPQITHCETLLHLYYFIDFQWVDKNQLYTRVILNSSHSLWNSDLPPVTHMTLQLLDISSLWNISRNKIVITHRDGSVAGILPPIAILHTWLHVCG